MNSLTELDYCVLGVIWRSAPLSAYGVRSHFRESTTPAWSSSSGSIYPSIRRLIGSGLISAGPAADRRGTQMLEITSDGVNQLRKWLLSFPPELGSPTPDPIRTRSQFLGSVSLEDRSRFVEKALLVTSNALTRLEELAKADAGAPADVFDQLASDACILELRARLKWLEKLARASASRSGG